MAKRIAIFGGSFNPIHNGHLILAEHAADYLGLEKVIFMPTFQNPFKPSHEYAPSRIRVEMIKAAIKGNCRFLLDTYEVDNNIKYTVETARHYTNKLTTKPMFILGQDSLEHYSKWKNPRELASLVTFLIPNHTGEPLVTPVEITDHRPFPCPPIEIRGSYIRARCEGRYSARYLVPEGVNNIMNFYGLWRKVHVN